MVASPVLMQAQGQLLPNFQRLVDDGKFDGGVEFCLVSKPTGCNSQRTYSAAARLLFLGYQVDTKEKATKALQDVFENAKRQGQVPDEAIFDLGDSAERGTTHYWALAILPSCGEFVATPTVCD